MKRSLKNTISVALATLMTGLAIFSAVTFTDALVGTTTTGTVAVSSSSVAQTGGLSTQPGSTGITAASTSGTLQYCPRTGCSATSCHATQGR